MITSLQAKEIPRPAATRNPCTVCAPLGACCLSRCCRCHSVPARRARLRHLHSSLCNGHYREPLDVACSNFNEQAAIFGGGAILRQGVANVITQYRPQLVGIATTCLSETIGDDLSMELSEFVTPADHEPPRLVTVSTPVTAMITPVAIITLSRRC